MENGGKMADSLTMREAQKREPIEEIKLKLAQDNSPLAPIVQDAMRLALLCKEHYYYMLFHSHLDGGLPKGDYLVSTFQEESLREKVLKAFESDRTWSLTPFGGSLQHMEEQLQNIQQQMNETPPRESKLWDAKIGIDHVLMNIREKVETLITELENPSSRLVRAAEVVSSEFPIRQVRQDGRIFIGHGRPPIWRELKDFLQEKLGL
jgi:archaellum component FlaC